VPAVRLGRLAYSAACAATCTTHRRTCAQCHRQLAAIPPLHWSLPTPKPPPPSPHPLRRRLSTHARVLSVPEFPHLPKVGPRQQWQSLAPRHEQTVERGGGGSQPSVGRLVQQHTSISNAVHGVVCRQPHHGREPIAWLRPASTLTPSKSTHSVYIWLKAERVVARACHGLVAPLCRPCHST